MIQPQHHLGTEANRIFNADQTLQLLKFGTHFPASSGGSAWLNADGTTDPSQGVQTWITARMAHVYAIGELLGFPEAHDLVDAALQGLTGQLHDDIHGGWYPQVRADGTPVQQKICYTHAFVILAATSAKLAGHQQAEPLLNDALDIFNRYFWDEQRGLAVDTWDDSWSNLDPYRGLNANMHTTEAFLSYADATGDEAYRIRAGRIIDHVITWARNNHWRIPEHFDNNWNVQLEFNADNKDDQFKPYGATPGHGIEWARLITQWAVSTFPNTTLRQPYIDAAEKLFHQALDDGWNVDGTPGLAYTTDWEGHPVVTDRMHWTLAEALNTSAILANVTGKELYKHWYAIFLQYVDQYIIDHELGSWFHQLDKHNTVIGTVWPGKSDLYHALQSTIIPFISPALSICSAIYEQAQNIDE